MKAIYDIIKKDDRIFFNDGEKYVLLDTGFVGNPFGKNSVSVNGKIGDIAVNTMPQAFFDSFINLKINGKTVDAVFNPMDGFNCWLQCGLLTICDEETEYDSSIECFFEFADAKLPIINGSINGQNCRFFFDSGARMTMFGDRSDASSEKIRNYTEWMALKHQYADLEVYKLNLAFPNGFEFCGEGALVEDPTYTMAAKMMNIRAMLGIDIFNFYDMAIITEGEKRGVALLKKCGN